MYLFDLHKALLCDVALARQRKRAFIVLAMRNVATGLNVLMSLCAIDRFGITGATPSMPLAPTMVRHGAAAQMGKERSFDNAT